MLEERTTVDEEGFSIIEFSDEYGINSALVRATDLTIDLLGDTRMPIEDVHLLHVEKCTNTLVDLARFFLWSA